MTNKTLEGMARAYLAERHGENRATVTVYIEDEAAMKAALLYLADNVSDEMVDAHSTTYDKVGLDKTHEESVRQGLSAALRAAAGGSE